MPILFEKDDKIRIHAKSAIAQLCAPFRSHEHGLPEWLKNSNSAYANANAESEDRVLTLFFGSLKNGEKYIALLDHAGMSVEDIEKRFSEWGNPEAFKGDADPDEIVEGGHGNGGKCYMTQMFDSYSYLYTVRGNRGSKYGFSGDDPNPGYFPDKKSGRGFPVSDSKSELRRALAELGIEHSKLPGEVLRASAHRDGFTLVAGVGPRNFEHKEAATNLVESVIEHSQSLITIERCRLYVVMNGKAIPSLCPVVLPSIPSHPDAPEPKVIAIPPTLVDPQTETEVATSADPHAPQGQLILRTSDHSMRGKLRGRHAIRYFAYKLPIASLAMEDISRSYWVDRMYGECYLDELRKFETNERSNLADSPLTRALRGWIKDQVLLYDAEFRKRESLKASQAQQESLRKQNQFLNEWIQESLEEEASTAPGERPGDRPRPRPRPLPEDVAVSVEIHSEFQRAGVGVALKLRHVFRNALGTRVASVPFRWNSSDWAVATVDDDINALVTHAPGVTSIWIETIDGRLRSNSIDVDVLKIASIAIEPREITLQAGKIQQLKAIVKDETGNEYSDVYLTWIQDDSSIVSVTATGKVIARRQGATSIIACDDNYLDESTQCIATVVPSEEPGTQGQNFPKILLSEIDPDPLNPDGETCHLSPEDGPVHQPTPQHVQHNIWWINMSCPLAKYYFEKHGTESTEWRSYHLERFAEALVKIKLNHLYQENDGISFDEMERRWREQAADVQARAVSELAGFLEGATISEMAPR